MSLSDDIRDSPFLRLEIIDRVLALSDPPVPYMTSISSGIYDTANTETNKTSAIALFTFMYTHCGRLLPGTLKQRADTLSIRLHMLVNPSTLICNAGKHLPETDALGKAADEVKILMVRLEMAVLALLPMPMPILDGQEEARQQSATAQAPGDSSSTAKMSSARWKEAESGAALVNTECGHLIKRMEGVIKRELQSGRAEQLQGCAPQARRHIRTALFLRGAALEVLRRVDEQYERNGRVERWEQQITDVQQRLDKI